MGRLSNTEKEKKVTGVLTHTAVLIGCKTYSLGSILFRKDEPQKVTAEIADALRDKKYELKSNNNREITAHVLPYFKVESLHGIDPIFGEGVND